MPFQPKKLVIAISLAFSMSNTYAQFGSELNLSDLNGTNGFVIYGASEFDTSGKSVSNAGDINGDDIDDLIVGAPLAGPNDNIDAGSSYVVFGSDTALPNPFKLSSINGINGFVINGVNAGDRSGISVSNAGDVNGDGIDDLIVGAINAGPDSNSRAGGSYVVFGSDTGLANPFNLSTINGLNGFVIYGVNADDISGKSVSYAGDINGDDIDDLIVGAPLAGPNGNTSAGSSYVVFGSDTAIPHPFNLSSINGTNGFVINGVNADDISGKSVSYAGDINGDGIDDLIVGAENAGPNGNTGAGSSYVVFGSDTGLPSPLNLSSINGTNGFVINGANTDDRLGYSVSSAGDINGDGIDDLIMGAFWADPNGNTSAGSSYVVFGNDKALPNPFNLSSINGTNGFVINGANEYNFSGTSVSCAGDINGDGIDDLIVGASATDPNGNISAGSSYVVFGSITAIPNPFNLSSINGNNGFIINGVNEYDFSGESVSHAGDINDDGMDDLIIGASGAGTNGSIISGKSYVVFGKSDVLFANGFE